MPNDTAKDLLSVDDHGIKAYTEFVQERLVKKSTSFHAPIKRLKLKTFASSALSKTVTSSKRKTKELVAERNVFGQLVLLAIHNHISIEKVLSYPLGPVPWSLATADGAPTRTDKAKLLHKLEIGHALPERPAVAQHIIDGNALLHELIQVPDTFADLAEKIFSHLPKATRVDFVTDTYKVDSIKNTERSRRGTSQEFLIKGPSTKVPRDFKMFLLNTQNKVQLIHLLLQEWRSNKYASRLVGRRLVVVDGEDCWGLTSSDGHTTDSAIIPGLCSTQVSSSL